MRKKKSGRKFGRKQDQRKSLLRGLARSLILHEKISTTEAKAKELRSYVEPVITKSKANSISCRRILSSSFDDKVVKKLLSDIGPRYKDRKGGYTRIIRRLPRKIDSAKRAIIEFV